MRNYPIQTVDGDAYSGPPGLEMLLKMEAPAYGTEISIPVYDGSTGTFVYCYAADTIVVGGAVQVGYDTYTSTSGYKSPMASIPDTTGAIYHLTGVACQAAAASGLWVQTKGRCFWARVDGGTDVTLGSFLVMGNGVQYFAQDHATVKTVAGSAIYEGCRHGAAGATAWTSTAVDGTATNPFPSLGDWPFYKYAETLAYNAQGNTTHGDPACVIYLTGVPAVI